MTRPFRRRPTGYLAAASLMLAGLVALSSAEARAGCHHPWVKLAAAPSTLVDLEILADAPGPDRSHGESPARPEPSPCARGACSPAPMIPLSTPEPTPRRAELWGSPALASRPSPGPAQAFTPEDDSTRPYHRTIPLDRPPR